MGRPRYNKRHQVCTRKWCLGVYVRLGVPFPELYLDGSYRERKSYRECFPMVNWHRAQTVRRRYRNHVGYIWRKYGYAIDPCINPRRSLRIKNIGQKPQKPPQPEETLLCPEESLDYDDEMPTDDFSQLNLCETGADNEPCLRDSPLNAI